MSQRNIPLTKSGNILLIWDRMGDYHRARWKELQHTIKDREVYAADLGRGDSLYQWRVTNQEQNYFLLTEEDVEQADSRKALSRFIELIEEKNCRYICIPGYGRNAYIFMLIAARLKGLEVLLFAESWYPGNLLIDRLKGMILNSLVDSFLVSGSRADAHFHRRLGIPAKKIYKGYSVVDNQHFRSGISNRKYDRKELLCIARYAEEKNLLILIDAFLASDLVSMGWVLKLIGDGPLKEILNARIASAKAKLKILVEEWKQYEELPELYHNASCFILPSLFEPWGLVVNEAMASGLPLILSEQVGCVPDLLDQRNGWAFGGENINELVKVLNELGKTSATQLEAMGKISGQKIEAFSLSTWAHQVLNGLNLLA